MAIETALGRVETSQPGIVTAYHSDNHTVDVQPVFIRSYERGEGNEIVDVKPPIIPNVPIWFLGAGDTRITFPVPKGSTVLLVHITGSKAAWQYSNGTSPVKTSDVERNTLTNAVAIPGGLTSKVAAKNSSGNARTADDGVVIHTPDKIYLGGGSTKPVARNTDVQDALISALTDPNVINGIMAYPAAAAIPGGAILALEALTAIIDLHFTQHPVAGSEVVEAE